MEVEINTHTKMQVQVFADHEQLKEHSLFSMVKAFQSRDSHSGFFQGLDFLQAGQGLHGFVPFMLVATSEDGLVAGTLVGVLQSSGSGITAWFSRRIIVWGGPLVAGEDPDQERLCTRQLLRALRQFGKGRAIFIEFRNLFDTAGIRESFLAEGFSYRPHLNFLVRTDDEDAVLKRMSKSRRRQIRTALKKGASLSIADREDELHAWYSILADLYREKVKKPLPGIDLFLQFWRAGVARVFLVKYEEQVIGGIFCPVHDQRVIYEWYVCGLDQEWKDLYPSVLATWAPIDFALRHDLAYFDFMGAGSPDKDYGVRDFKARFGGEEVCFGRYSLVLNKALYRFARAGLQLYQKMKT